MTDRKRLVRIAVPLLAVALVSAGSSARPAHSVTRWDPRRDAYVDVWKTSKNRIDDGSAGDDVRFKVVARLSNDWALAVYVDIRGRSDPEFRLRYFERFGLSQCDLRRLPDGEHREIPCGLQWVNDVKLARLWWRVPRHRLRTHGDVIRWHVHTHDVGFDPGRRHDDRAPDTGWFP